MLNCTLEQLNLTHFVLPNFYKPRFAKSAKKEFSKAQSSSFSVFVDMVVPVLQGLPGSGCFGMTTANFELLLEYGLAPFLPAMLQDSPSTSSSQHPDLTQDVDQTQVEGQGPPIPSLRLLTPWSLTLKLSSGLGWYQMK